MAFKDILGNSRVKKILQKALQKNKVPNSMLFCGTRGIGKREMALVLAKAMNCERKKDDACEVCQSCKAINARNFPDVIEISPEKEVIQIDQMRMLRKIAYLKPMMGKKRVFVVVDADRMTEQAANSLLKVLEEPPLFSYIILVAHNPFLIMPTIKSRCQVLNFSPISKEDIGKTLVEKGYAQKKARIISLLVRGNLKQALALEWEDVQDKRTKAWELFLSLLRRGKVALFLRDYGSSQRALVRDEWEQVLEMLSSFCRDSILIKEGGDRRFLMNPDYEKEISKEGSPLSLEELMDCLTKIDYAIYGLGKNLNMNLLVSSFFSYFKESEYV
jgi:DNA polymerase-3 subunit delta'